MISRTALAAHAILGTTASLSFMPFLGFSVACCIRVGQALGELKPVEAQRSYHVSMAVTLLLIAFNTAIVLGGRSFWGEIFTDDVQVSAVVANTMPLLAGYTVFDGIQCVSTGALRGLSQPGPAAAINVFSYVAIGLPAAYTLALPAGLELGLPGIWLGFIIAVLVASLCMSGFILRTDWAAKAKEARDRGLKPAGGH